MMNNPQTIEHARAYIQEKLGNFQPNTIGVILGTGLGGWIGSLQGLTGISYKDIPGFPSSTVESHAGKFVRGTLGSRPFLAMCGRFHLYEGYDAVQALTGVRTMGALGIKTLILTNAAGALNPNFDTGSLMLLTDHINFTGESPLRGPNHDPWGPRFPDMARVYDQDLRELAVDAASRLGIRLERGVYMQVTGPNLETPAETRAFRLLGADAVGMSTAIEAVCARHMGMRVMGISCLTNKNLPDCMEETTLEDVISQADKSSASLGRLLTEILASMPENGEHS